jgi:hypothetical protein
MITALTYAGRRWYVFCAIFAPEDGPRNDSYQILAKEFNRSILARDSGKMCSVILGNKVFSILLHFAFLFTDILE